MNSSHMGRGYNTQFLLRGPWCDKIIFCRFIIYMRHSMTDLTRCYKTEVFKKTFCALIFAVFSISIHSCIAEGLLVLLQHLQNKRTPYGNSTSSFDFELFIVVGMWFCTDVTNFIRIRRSLTELWRYRLSNVAAIPTQAYFRFLVLWCLAFRKAKN